MTRNTLRGAPGTPEDLRDVVRREVRHVLAELLAAIDTPKAYSTRRGHAPPGYADHAWKDLAPTIPGAVRRGRWWTVTREALEAYEAQREAKPANDGAPPPPAVPWTPAGALEAAGLRRPR